jgi:ATP-binding protein involved in chromosome partitioning
MAEDISGARQVERLHVEFTCQGDCGDCEIYFECFREERKRFEEFGLISLVRSKLKGVKHKILVLGGKGGVGKSMVAVNLGAALYSLEKKVCIVDQNFDCPAVPTMLGIAGEKLKFGEKGLLLPVETDIGIKAVSMGLILGEDEVIVWFHESKRMAAEEFLINVDYGELDYMVVDVPAGTSSETVNAMRILPDIDASIVVTVPSEVSQNVAEKAVLLSQKANIPVFAVMENMGQCQCPNCKRQVSFLQSGGGTALAEKVGVNFGGVIPMDLRVSQSLDDGKPFVLSHPDIKASKVIMKIAKEMIESFG